MILITGGAGYIGSHTNKVLSKRGGFDTLILDNLSEGHRDFVKWGELVTSDLSNPDQIEDLFYEDYGIEAVIHFAGSAYVRESIDNPMKYYSNNVSNSINLFNMMKKYDVNKLIFSSSCTVYGENDNLIDETMPTNPTNPYGRTKLMIENIISDYGFDCINLRYFNAAGADPKLEVGERHNPETHIIPTIINSVITGKEMELYGNVKRDFTHVKDLACGHLRALRYIRSRKTGSISVNLGTGRAIDMKTIIKMVEKKLNKTANIKELPKKEYDPQCLVADNKKSKSLLGLKYKYNIEDIIDTAVDWYKKENGL